MATYKHASMSMPDIISDQSGAARLCAMLRDQTVLGLDTEFMRERTYFARLCLLQLSFDATAVCIDTLALTDLGELRPVLASPPIRKVVHAARQDLEVLWPLTGSLRPLFDTQIAAALIGLPAQIGYAELVSRLLGRSLHKSQTRTDWSRRPLTHAQLAYALDDVRYLPQLAERLEARLEQLERRQWFEEEMAELEGTSSFQVDPEQAWRRFKGLDDLDDARRALAGALAAWRERRAIASDRPRNWVLPDAAVRAIVARVPRTLEELAAIPELPAGMRHHSGEQIVTLIESLQLPATLPPVPQRRRPPPAESEAVHRLAQLTQEAGRELGIAPEILATRREMERLVAGARDEGPLAGWRRSVIGERLLGAL
jgi:ribonuclease D